MTVNVASAECFNTASFKSKAASERARVLEYIRGKGACTRREIAGDLGIERGVASRAVCELMEGGDKSLVVELIGLHPCPISKRPVTWVCLRSEMLWAQARRAS